MNWPSMVRKLARKALMLASACCWVESNVDDFPAAGALGLNRLRKGDWGAAAGLFGGRALSRASGAWTRQRHLIGGLGKRGKRSEDGGKADRGRSRSPPQGRARRMRSLYLCSIVRPEGKALSKQIRLGAIRSVCGLFAARAENASPATRLAGRPCSSSPTRISRLPAWLAGPMTPSFSMRSISEAARL